MGLWRRGQAKEPLARLQPDLIGTFTPPEMLTWRTRLPPCVGGYPLAAPFPAPNSGGSPAAGRLWNASLLSGKTEIGGGRPENGHRIKNRQRGSDSQQQRGLRCPGQPPVRRHPPARLTRDKEAKGDDQGGEEDQPFSVVTGSSSTPSSRPLTTRRDRLRLPACASTCRVGS